jgi:SAM-dependent methyltransferase
MTTLPVSPGEPHEARQIAESFGQDAQRYDRTRPSYPTELVDRIIAASPGKDVLDVGCGTGIATRQFQAAGCTVLGVEPDERMAALARQAGFEVEVATFEAWEPAGRTFDAVVAGQAWHWVDPVAGAAVAADVLRPGGRIALFWNSFQPPADLAQAFAEVTRKVLPDSPASRAGQAGADPYGGIIDRAAGGIAQAGVFSATERWSFDWQRDYTRDEWLAQVPTFGLATRLPKDTLAELLAGIGAAIDTAGGAFTMQYSTLVGTATRN